MEWVGVVGFPLPFILCRSSRENVSPGQPENREGREVKETERDWIGSLSIIRHRDGKKASLPLASARAPVVAGVGRLNFYTSAIRRNRFRSVDPIRAKHFYDTVSQVSG